MLLEISLFFLGIFFGVLSGLTPGIHINLVAALLISLQIANFVGPLPTVIFIVAMATTHTFIDFIPSIFLGAPDSETALATLPGHKMLLEGDGNTAVKLTATGGLLAITIFIIILPLFLTVIPKIQNFTTTMIPFLLIWTIIYMIYLQKRNKTYCLIIITLAGLLGISTLNLSINQPLLPLLTGLFGSSIIITSIKTKSRIPKQKIEKMKIKNKDLIKPALATSIVSPICSFLPGLGSNQAAIISSSFFKKGDDENHQFLILIGSINTLVMAVAFVTLFVTGNIRSGAAAAIDQIIQIDAKITIAIIITIILAAIISFFLTNYLSTKISNKIHKINYTKISYTTLTIILVLVIAISGLIGFLVFITSTIVGLFCTELNVPKSFLMASLIIPTIIFYL